MPSVTGAVRASTVTLAREGQEGEEEAGDKYCGRSDGARGDALPAADVLGDAWPEPWRWHEAADNVISAGAARDLNDVLK